MEIFRPHEFESSETEIIAPANPLLTVSGDFTGEAKAILAARGWKIGAQGNWIVEVARERESRFLRIPESGRESDEIYELQADAVEGAVRFVIRCASVRGLRCALNAMEDLAQAGRWTGGKYFDYPSFSMRGVVEGFYGFPWTDGERAGIMELMERLRMNTYFYGPKNDVFHREKWDVPYAEEALSQLTQTAARAAGHGLDFYYCLGPGLTIAYSRPEDLEKLVEKVRQAYRAGVRRFGLFLDDIPPTLQYAGDIETFADLADAHIWFVNQFYDAVRAMDPGIMLALCPQQYTGTGTEDYITRLGRGIPADMRLMWTGPDICSKELTVAGAEAFRISTGHMPLYWDNYPVNDANMYNEMHLGPLIGRQAELGFHCEGLLSNGMEAAECTKIPLVTIGAYLWNPEGYDPESAFRWALLSIAGKRDGPDLIYFADNLRMSCLRDRNSYMLAKCLYNVRFLRKSDREDEAAAALQVYLDHLEQISGRLRRGLENAALQNELSRWIDKHFQMVSILRDCQNYLKTKDDALLSTIRQAADRYKENAAVYAGFCFEEFVDDLTGKFAQPRHWSSRKE